jgi:hypothetical protein
MRSTMHYIAHNQACITLDIFNKVLELYYEIIILQSVIRNSKHAYPVRNLEKHEA